MYVFIYIQNTLPVHTDCIKLPGLMSPKHMLDDVIATCM